MRDCWMNLLSHAGESVARDDRPARSTNPTMQCLRVCKGRSHGLSDRYGSLRARVELAARP